MKLFKMSERIQILLSTNDYKQLQHIILNESISEGKILSTSAYVRSIILDHISEHKKIQKKDKE